MFVTRKHVDMLFDEARNAGRENKLESVQNSGALFETIGRNKICERKLHKKLFNEFEEERLINSKFVRKSLKKQLRRSLEKETQAISIKKLTSIFKLKVINPNRCK